jgi:hypothetical protein
VPRRARALYLPTNVPVRLPCSRLRSRMLQLLAGAEQLKRRSSAPSAACFLPRGAAANARAARHLLHAHAYEGHAVSARWMKLGRRGRNAFALGAGRVQGNASARNQSPYTVLVHKLKTDEDLLRVKEVFSRLEASREPRVSLPRPRAACVGGSSGTSSLSLPVATTAGVRVAVLGG